jgi:glyoxylate reductase
LTRPRVLLTRKIPSSILALLTDRCDVDLNDGDGGLPRDDLKRRVADKDALIAVLTDKIDGEIMDAGAALKVIANIAVGYDNIDVPAARQRGIIVTNTPDVLTEAVAELTWAMILGLVRRVAEGDRLIRADGWKGWSLDFMLGTELRGKQLGIIGGGRIGRAVAAKAPAFGMTAAFAARRGRSDGAMSLDELLVTSDVISIHTPLNSETRHLIDRRALARMKRSAFLVNTSRGPVIDEDALAWALGEHLIAGAALDVHEREPEVHPALATRENVLLTPHLGSATRETRTAMAELAVRNVLAVTGGQDPLTAVT